jgi:predicted dehydrogenase
MQINSKSLNIGILGKGDFTENLIQNLQEKKIIGMCVGLHSHSFDELITLRNYDELEKAADAVLLFDPTFCLFENLTEILKSCKHVFLGNTTHLSRLQLKKLASIANEAGVNLQVSNRLRFLNIHHEIKDQDVEPHIIECSHYIQRKGQDAQLSLIEDILLPDIDVVLSLAKSRVKNVFATGVGVLFDDPDVVNARIEFYNGCNATISASRIADKDVHKIRFFQNNYYYTLNYQNQSLRVVKGAENNDEEDLPQNPPLVDDETNYHDMVNQHEILEKEIESFYYCIVLGTEPACNIQDFIEARTVADRVVDQLERNFRRK